MGSAQREAIDAGYETDIKKLTEEIGEEVSCIGDDGLAEKVNAAVKDATAKKDTQSLEGLPEQPQGTPGEVRRSDAVNRRSKERTKRSC